MGVSAFRLLRFCFGFEVLGFLPPLMHHRIGNRSIRVLVRQENPSADEDDVVPTEAYEFFSTLENWMKNKEVTNKDPLRGHTLEDLEGFVKDRENSANPEVVTDDDSPWIDADAYFEAEKDEERSNYIMDPDYQLAFRKFLEQQSPGEKDTFGNDATPEDLWNLIREKGLNISNYYDPAVADDLHHQVFAEEPGFLDNSDIFLESLTDPTLAAAAAAERRGHPFRERQRNILTELNQDMQEFDKLRAEAPQCAGCLCSMLSIKRRSPVHTLCVDCFESLKVKKAESLASEVQPGTMAQRPPSRMLETTDQLLDNERGLEKQLGSWTGMVDPDTKEVFYWNDETSEMSWNRPEDSTRG